MAVVRALAVASFLALALPAAASVAPPPDHVDEFGWSAEGYVDPAFEAERAQMAFDDQGRPVSLWAGRATVDDPFQILWSVRTNELWSPAAPAFAATPASERLPQISRAPDGTIWAAWLRDDNRIGSGSFHAPSLLAARLSGGAWSLPETVAVETPALNEKALEVDFSILAVSHDEAWLTWTVSVDGDPFSGDHDLVAAQRSAAGWSAPVLVSNNGLSEARPVLVRTLAGVPVVFFGFSNAPSLLRAVRWNGTDWSSTPDDLTSPAIYGYDAAPDTGGAVRLLVDLREDTGTGVEYHLREFVLNSSGFHQGKLLDSAPVLAGGENDPPDWSGVSLSSGRPCPECESIPNELVFRAMWIDFTQGGQPKVLSSLRTSSDFQPYEQVGTSYETALAFPRALHEVATNRWFGTWTAPPSFGGRRRAKFAFTQEFAGDLSIGASFVEPDTVRVTLLCSGDATGRTFRLYRLNWPTGQGSPPFSPPVPAAAVALPGNPYPGPCPLTIDDFPGPGRWYYYVELDAQGSFPARSARSFNAAVVPDGGGGGGGTVTTSALRSPTPQPALGYVALPFQLAAPADVTLLVRDLRGRLVRTFALGHLQDGLNGNLAGAPVWDGKDDDGSRVRSGVYFETLVVDGAVVGDGRRIVFFP